MADDVLEENTLTSVSYSQYSTYENCPLEWQLKYVEHLGESDGIAAVFGTAMHDTIQYWVNLLYTEEPLKSRVFDMHDMLKTRLMELAKERLLNDGKQLTTKEEISEYYADGCNILDHVRKYARDWFPKSHELIGTEILLEIELPNNLKFKGYLDIVLYHKAMKTVYIYDFKTSRYGWTYQKKDVKKTDQLLLYKKFYSQKFNVPEANIKVEFIILKRKVNDNSQFESKHVVGFEPSNGTISMKRTTERFAEFLNTAFASDGTPKTTMKATPSDRSCKYCPFNNNNSLCAYSAYLPNADRKFK